MLDRKVIVAGVGMIPFTKPGQSGSYQQMGGEATRLSIEDAGISFDDIQQAYVGYVYGESVAGQATLYNIGMSGIPIVNVTNNCSTGSTALFLARQAVASGAMDCVLALGVEQMVPGSLGLGTYEDRPHPMARFMERTTDLFGHPDVILTGRFYAGAGEEHMRKYGTKLSTFASIRAKASRHATRNPLAIFRRELSIEEVLESPPIVPGLLTRLMACPPTCGASAAILVSEAFANKRNIDKTVQIKAQAMTTDRPSTFDTGMINLIGYEVVKEAADKVYEEAGVGPEAIDVVELHDCFAQNELVSYEGLGLAAQGEAEAFVLDGDNTYGGKVVTNPSGGLLSKGHPLGATGLAQCYELTQQLRGNADARQVAGARFALAQNMGLGGACVVTLFERT